MPTLHWVGKEAVVDHHRHLATHSLAWDSGSSAGDPAAGNLLVEGDNLTALRALLPHYAGRVKCVYIDPPYNTGKSAWIYNDNVDDPRIRKWLGEVVGAEAEDLCRHDKWLCMMYPRLALLREFLREDGVLFISIDDHEVGHLRLLADEVFGETNFLADVIWQKKYTRANDARFFSDNHDHILCYARHKPACRLGRIERTAAQDKAYRNPDNHPLGPWKPTPLHAKSGTSSTPYTFRNGVTWQPPPGTFRRFTDESMARLESNNEIWFGTKSNAVPQRKTFLGSLADGTVPVTIWLHEIAGDNHMAREEIKALVPEADAVFETPKPRSLIELVLQLAGDPDALVLDAFAGSGTTGHAVLSLNQRDGGRRRFLLVELDEGICRRVTARRLERAIAGYAGEAGLGSGFQYCRLGPPVLTPQGERESGATYLDLARLVYLVETGMPLPTDSVATVPLLGVQQWQAIYLLGRDESNRGGACQIDDLTYESLAVLSASTAGVRQKVVYAADCRISTDDLEKAGIRFRRLADLVGQSSSDS
ncbi:MAG: site-specific DNA-methyltransferase [Planctomycetes bacterium]|nr:site-specific DNA-methyltransferase [Planctomycetota bacterium]